MKKNTVTVFLVDTSPSMGQVRDIEIAPGPNGEVRITKFTHLEWALRYVKMKVQEMARPSVHYSIPRVLMAVSSDLQWRDRRQVRRNYFWF